MANLIGYLKDEHKSNAKRVSRTSSTTISGQLETWEGAIRTQLDRDGNFKVYIGDKGSPSELIAHGNVNVNGGEYSALGLELED